VLANLRLVDQQSVRSGEASRGERHRQSKRWKLTAAAKTKRLPTIGAVFYSCDERSTDTAGVALPTNSDTSRCFSVEVRPAIRSEASL